MLPSQNVLHTNFTGTVKGGDLVLEGLCSECRGDVARLIEIGVMISVEELFVKFLDLNRLLHRTANIESNHQSGQQRAIYQYDSLAQKFSRFFCRW